MYGSREGEGQSPSLKLCPVLVVGHREAVYTGCRLWLFSGARLRICAAQILHVFQPYIFSLRPVIDPLWASADGYLEFDIIYYDSY